jgi:methylenetetrahydrofolate reductase (NADPH)
LREALLDKQSLLASAGVAGEISTQMCFDAAAIVAWLRSMRAAGVTMPVRLGIPGAVERAKLLSLGTRLGIGASLRYLRKNAAVMSKLVGPGGYDPLELLDEIALTALGADAGTDLGIDGLHVFTFNAMAPTIQWWQRATAGSEPEE